MPSRTIAVLSASVGLLFLVVAFVYATHNASALPHYFPGYDAAVAKHHTKHAIAAGLLAVGAFILAWFQSAPSKPASQA